MGPGGLTMWPPVQLTDCVGSIGHRLAYRGRRSVGERVAWPSPAVGYDAPSTNRRSIGWPAVQLKRRPARRHLSARNSTPTRRRCHRPYVRRQSTELLSHGPTANSITLDGIQKTNVTKSRREFVSLCFPWWWWSSRFRTPHRRSARN